MEVVGGWGTQVIHFGQYQTPSFNTEKDLKFFKFFETNEKKEFESFFGGILVQ